MTEATHQITPYMELFFELVNKCVPNTISFEVFIYECYIGQLVLDVFFLKLLKVF